MKVVIIDYGSGNLHSAAKAFESVAGKNAKISVSNKARDLKSADKIVLPGVGAFGDCRAGLDEINGMIDALEEQVIENEKPFFGICVGMQLLADKGMERGTHKGFGWVKGEVKRIKPKDKKLKIPHMGWNELQTSRHPIFKGVRKGDHAYFVHSYHLSCKDKKDVIAQVDYGGSVTAAVAKDNIIGVQFHPEKSQKTGLKIIKNFLEI